MEKKTIGLLALVLLLATGCSPVTYTHWLLTPDGKSVKCTVTEGVTTESRFNRTCGKARVVQDSRGCRSYYTDKNDMFYYCFEKGRLTKMLTLYGWERRDD